MSSMPGDLPAVSEERSTSGSSGIFSCVVDDKRRFHLEALRWYATLTRVVGARPEDLCVHAVEGTDSEVLGYLRAHDVSIVSIERFDSRSPHCNKISGAIALGERLHAGVAVLSDSDVAILEDPRGIRLGASSVGLCLVPGANPPLHILRRVFEAAGLDDPPLAPLEFRPGEFTFANHGNGGLYLVPVAILQTVASSWAKWARWLLDHAELLERWTWFLDQTSFTLAVTEQAIQTQVLDLRWNYPLGRAKKIARKVEPAVIHYHRFVTDEGYVTKFGVDAVDRRIDVINAAISEIWHEALPKGGDIPVAAEPIGTRGDRSRRKPVAAIRRAWNPFARSGTRRGPRR